MIATFKSSSCRTKGGKTFQVHKHNIINNTIIIYLSIIIIILYTSYLAC